MPTAASTLPPPPPPASPPPPETLPPQAVVAPERRLAPAALAVAPLLNRYVAPGRSLFWKFYFWFLLGAFVIAGIVTVMVRFTDPELLFPTRRYIPIHLRDKQAALSAKIYERNGAAALRTYLESIPQNNDKQPDGARPVSEAFLFDRTGQEVSGAEPPSGAPELIAQAWGNQDQHVELRLSRSMTALQTAGPSGTAYVFLSVTPRKSLFVPADWLGWLRVGAVLVAAAALCWWLARSMASPVLKLRAAARQLAGGNLSARVDPALARRGDEFSELAHDFDDMAARIEELLIAQRRLIGDVSHELGSPLTRVNVALGLAFRKAGPEVQPQLERIGRETKRLNSMIHQLLLLSQLESSAGLDALEDVDLRELVEDVAADASFEAESAGRRVRVETAGAAGCQVRGARHLLRSAVENVVRNAVKHTAPDTEVFVALEALAGGAQPGTAVVRVCDCGPGVPPGELEKIFKPFYRLSEARGHGPGLTGTGLGLAIAQRAVEAHGGTVQATNRERGGLCVEIELRTVG